MPKGRGRKRERAPRKRSVGNQKPVSKVVSRVALDYNSSNNSFQPHSVPRKGQALSQQSSNLFQSVQSQYRPSELFLGPVVSYKSGPNAILPSSFTSPQQPQFYVQPQSTPQTSLQPQSTPQTPFQFPSPTATQQPLQTNQPPRQLSIPCFPSPGEGQFIVYLLQYCPSQTSVCFGCGNTLKPNATFLLHQEI